MSKEECNYRDKGSYMDRDKGACRDRDKGSYMDRDFFKLRTVRTSML